LFRFFRVLLAACPTMKLTPPRSHLCCAFYNFYANIFSISLLACLCHLIYAPNIQEHIKPFLRFFRNSEAQSVGESKKTHKRESDQFE